MHRTGTPLARLLACAAVVPVMLVAGCSSDSDSGSKNTGSGASKSSEPSAEPSVEAAKYAKLPQPCKALSEKTIKDIVPKAKDAGGTTGESDDSNARGLCSWNGLDGFQYRWLDVALQRFDSDRTLGSGESRAEASYAKQVDAAKGAADEKGSKGLKSGTAAGVGDEAATFRFELEKDKEDFRNQTVVVRTENVVITLNYNGAGYESGKTPKGEDLLKDAEKAAKEVVASVAEANGAGAPADSGKDDTEKDDAAEKDDKGDSEKDDSEKTGTDPSASDKDDSDKA
ncbi:DUF3558 domain-containing protein [Streptomyces sp. NPDC002055]|uniref:DUF3558 domain-containing protein n=1 Tax=Streptomyces sp. NPDC002055 TaxID=3154534 RepID=UPI00331C4BC8